MHAILHGYNIKSIPFNKTNNLDKLHFFLCWNVSSYFILIFFWFLKFCQITFAHILIISLVKLKVTFNHGAFFCISFSKDVSWKFIMGNQNNLLSIQNTATVRHYNLFVDCVECFRSCFFWFYKFWIYFSKYYRPLGSWSALLVEAMTSLRHFQHTSSILFVYLQQ